MNVRQDLLDLTPAALAALANAGFVKRAQKDLAQGSMPVIEQAEDGTVSARYDDGQQATLGPGRSLREALCSCPASGLCRHRVTLVLAYQQWAQAASAETDEVAAEPWSPAHFDDAALAACLPPRTLSQAAKLADAQPVVRVLAWQPDMPAPSAHLPTCTVRFFSQNALAHARCDCSDPGGCAHIALAVWAFRQAERQQAGFAELRVALEPPTPTAASSAPNDPREAQLFAALDALAWQLWQDGSGQPPEALEWPLRQALTLAQTLGWRWVEDQLGVLEQLLHAQQTRSSQFQPEALLRALAELHGRAQAARHARAEAARGEFPRVPASEILGLGVPGVTELDSLRLISLGAEYWLAAEEEGARLLFVDPDTQTVLVLAHSWERKDTEVSLARRRLLKQSLGKVAAGQILSKAARRAANGALTFYADARHTTVMPLAPQSWDSLAPPLRQHSARQLAERLLAALPDFVRPLQAAEHVHVLSIAEVLDWHWDPARQILRANLQSGVRPQPEDADEDILQLHLPYSSAAPQAIDTLAQILDGHWGSLRAVAGPVRLEAGQPVMRPLAVMTERRAIVLHSEPANPRSLPLQGVADEPSPFAQPLQATRELLIGWLRQGLRHQGTSIDSSCQTSARALTDAGWPQTAESLRSLPSALRGSDAAQRLPQRLASLALLLEDMLRAADH